MKNTLYWRSSSISNFVNGFHCSIQCSIITDGKVCTEISLSIVPGTPITFTPNSSGKFWLCKCSSPPIHTKASIPFFLALFESFLSTFFGSEFFRTAERRIVPPKLMILFYRTDPSFW